MYFNSIYKYTSITEVILESPLSSASPKEVEVRLRATKEAQRKLIWEVQRIPKNLGNGDRLLVILALPVTDPKAERLFYYPPCLRLPPLVIPFKSLPNFSRQGPII